MWPQVRGQKAEAKGNDWRLSDEVMTIPVLHMRGDLALLTSSTSREPPPDPGVSTYVALHPTLPPPENRTWLSDPSELF